ncbi:hypothetical protein [Lentzea flaviverrucosa]|uniref:Pentapeptide repeat-containing protein n=1 Tax=Lentzea flaviverrucosa TaxID=200379 RepID=A0A1H9PZN2_9PSEU|nr:hypothetical protein [Lentzea flaviverrucosa]RDI29674.1 hypothetical protein DFR72_10592 [Lentzea flaviverrucosa]SER53610.1 hypothetical protein SAMN05216195_105481 [Lentzea flaviverrucosa]
MALVVAYRRQRISESAETREQTKLRNERFGAACNQIGNESPTVRLDGVHALAALADEWSAQRQVCIDVLCAYLRIPYEPALESEWYLDAESEDLVRAVLRSADCSGVQVPSGKFFLSLARFPTGWISFDGMVVSGGEVSFRGARFTGGEVDLSEAVISVAPVFDEGEKPGLKLP